MLHQSIQRYLHRNHFPKLAPQAVFFDMDGVLFDSMPEHAAAWTKTMHEAGLPFTEAQAYLHEGQPATETINHVFEQFHGRPSTEAEQQAIYGLKSKYFDAQGEPKPMPFAFELANKLKDAGFNRFVVTGSAQPLLLEKIHTAFPRIFNQNIISAFDVTQGKPHPEPYLKALAKADVLPWQAVVIENAPFGVRSASAAQIFTIGVNTGPLPKDTLLENGADTVFDSLQELFEQWDTFGFSTPHPSKNS